MKEIISQTTQDYLKVIYELVELYGFASTTALADRLNVSPASVTGMLQRLAAGVSPLVIYQKHHGATLTQAGILAALEVIRHHRLLETYLYTTMGYSWDQVHDEADRLEHVISEVFEERIAVLLGNPTRDPHGELIPSTDLAMPADHTVPLSKVVSNQEALIVRVKADDANLLRYLESLGLVPGELIKVVEISPFDQNISVKIGLKEQTKILGVVLANSIFVQLK